MKKLYIILPAILLITMVCNYTIAQVNVKMFEVEALKTNSTASGMYLAWKSSLATKGDVFLVEKLNKDWDYVAVGKVEANDGNAYRLIDSKPLEGENYYRITLVKNEGQSLISDLLIADYFVPKQNDFKYLFNDKFANYAALKNVETLPKDIGYFGANKYAQNILKLRRVKSESNIPIIAESIKSKSLIASTR